MIKDTNTAYWLYVCFVHTRSDLLAQIASTLCHSLLQMLFDVTATVSAVVTASIDDLTVDAYTC